MLFVFVVLALIETLAIRDAADGLAPRNMVRDRLARGEGWRHPLRLDGATQGGLS